MESSANPSSSKSVRTYGLVFLALAAITLVELLISGSTVGFSRSLLNLLLISLSLGKASLVAAFFMHLRHDSRLYTYVFIIPVVLLLVFALTVIIR